MASIQIPANDSEKINKDLLNKYNIEIPIFEWNNQSMLRFSFNAYNDEEDSQTLINAIKDMF
jgi:isopenicillin-N epimerase